MSAGDLRSGTRAGSGDPRPAHALNVDLSAISAATDVVLGHGDPLRSVLDLNFQTSLDAYLPDRICLYNAALRYRFHVPVHSVVILLRPKADDPNLTGRLTYSAQPRRGKMDFRYEVIRIWEIPAKRLLRCGPGVLPLSVLGAMPLEVSTEDGIAEVVASLCRRVERAYDRETANHLITSTLVLSGLRLDRELAVNMFRRYRAMEDSTTFQYILELGALRWGRSTLLDLGAIKFGEPTEKVKTSIQDLEDLSRIKRMEMRILTAGSWDDILETS